MAVATCGPTFSLDAQAAFASSLGPSMAAMSSIAVPLGPEANFDPKRDIKRVILGLYSLQGADVAVVIQGTFDPDAIRSAASRGAMTPLGVPLTVLNMPATICSSPEASGLLFRKCASPSIAASSFVLERGSSCTV
ncbi:MAG: hypothetical protein WCJ30_16800, partial [Deltaproteobacteria bacterium]